MPSRNVLENAVTGSYREIIDLLSNATDQRLTRRQVQQRVSRRIPTWYLDRMLGHLLALDRITVEGEWIYDRVELDRRRQARDLHRKLVSVVWSDGSCSTTWAQ